LQRFEYLEGRLRKRLSMMIRYSALILAFTFVAACGGDDDSGTPAGGAGGIGGTGGTGGSGGIGGMAGSSGVGGTGGMGGSGGGGMGGSGGGGMGGSGGMMEMDDDSGVDDDGGVEVDAGADAGNTGDEGAQNGACRAAGDACDDGLGCYQPDENLPAFCTLECAENEDCDALGGATWTCFTNGGLCRVECDSGNGNDDCPAGFECTDVVGAERCLPIE
jgi:hypothetical protein